MTVNLMLGDCLERMAEIPSASVDAIITDPPYPEIDRPYGRLTEPQWWALMMGVCRESRRVLKPTGSAVFILQPNSKKVGSMRGWLFEFQAWACREWNMVQDAWWWKFDAMPLTKNDPNLMRSSVKACVWLGPSDCYRDASSVLWEESQASRAALAAERLAGRSYEVRDKETRVNVVSARMRAAAKARGGVTPFNILPVGADGKDGTVKHSARTPMLLADWWGRYISPPGGVVLDPFIGSGTVGLAALNRGRSIIGIERDPGYFAIAEKRIHEAKASHPLFSSAG